LFVDTNVEYLELDSAPVIAPPFTVAAWARWDRGQDISSDDVIVWVGDKDVGDHSWYLHFSGATAGDPVRFIGRAGTIRYAVTTTGFTAGQWHHVCGIAYASDSRAVFIDGGSKGTNVLQVDPAGADRVSIGRAGDFTPSNYLRGCVAEVLFYSVALNDDEVAALAKGYSPLLIRPQSLVAYWPLIRDAGQDRVGGFDLSANGTIVANHPPVVRYPWVPRIGIPGQLPPEDFPVSASLACSRGVSHVPLAATFGGVSLGASRAAEHSAVAAALSPLSLSRVAGLSVDRLVNLAAGLSLDLQSAVGLSGSAQALTGLSLAILREINLNWSGFAFVSLALERALGLSPTAAADSVAGVGLSLSSGLESSSAAQAIAGVVLDALYAVDPTILQELLASLNLDSEMGISSGSVAGSLASVTLDRDAAVVIAASAVALASASLGSTHALAANWEEEFENVVVELTLAVQRSILDSAAAESFGDVVLSSEFGVVFAVVLTSLFIGFVVPPESRVIKIGRDERCFMAQGL